MKSSVFLLSLELTIEVWFRSVQLLLPTVYPFSHQVLIRIFRWSVFRCRHVSYSISFCCIEALNTRSFSSTQRLLPVFSLSKAFLSHVSAATLFPESYTFPPFTFPSVFRCCP